MVGKNTFRQLDSIWNLDRGLNIDNPYFLKLPGSYHWSYDSSPSDKPGEIDSIFTPEPGMIRYNQHLKSLEMFVEDITSSTPDSISGEWICLRMGPDSYNQQGDYLYRFGDMMYGDIRMASPLANTDYLIDNTGSASYGKTLIQRSDVLNEPAILNAQGIAAKPSYSFEEIDQINDTGMYRADEDVIGFSTNGVSRGLIEEEGITIQTGVVYNQTGNHLLPGYTFLNDTDTGVYETDTTIIFSTNSYTALSLKSGTATPESLVSGINTIATVYGNLNVLGNTTNFDTVDLVIEDNIILLNKNETGNGVVTPTHNFGGFEIERGTLPNVSWLFDETNDWWGPYGTDGDINPTEKQIGNIKEIDTRTAGEILYVDGNSIRLRGPGSFGSESAPAFSWEDDPDTGIFKSGNSSIDFSSEGIKKVSVTSNNVAVSGTGALTLPVGNNSERPSTPIIGMLRYNSEIRSVEGYKESGWSSLGGSFISDTDKDTFVRVEQKDISGNWIDNDTIEVFCENDQKLFTDEQDTYLYGQTTFNSNNVFEHKDLGEVSGTVTLNPVSSFNFLITLVGDTTITFDIPNSSNMYIEFCLWIQQGEIPYSLTYDRNIRWPNGGTSHEPTQKENAIDVVEFCSWDNGTTWYAFHIAVDFNYALQAISDNFTVQQWDTVYIDESSLLANDLTLNPPLSVLSVQNPTRGTLTHSSSIIGFTSTDLRGRPASFEYTIQDGIGNTTYGIVNVDVTQLPEIEALLFQTEQEALDYMTTNVPESPSEIFNNWTRFDNNQWYPKGSTLSANAASWTYNETTDIISCTINSSTHIGFVSDDKFDNYIVEATLSSNQSDDDMISIVAAIERQGSINKILTFTRTCNGANTWGPGIPNWCAVLDLGGSHGGSDLTGTVIQSKISSITAPVGGGWNANGSTKVRVHRTGNIIKAYCSPFGSSVIDPATEIIIDLSAIPSLNWAMGKKAYGYSCYSQENSSFDNMSITGILNTSEVYVLTSGEVYIYDIDNGWILTPSNTIGSRLGYPRYIYNPKSDDRYFIDENQIVTLV